MMTQNDNSAIQDIAMAMIAYSGEGRTLAFNALDAMHRDDYPEHKHY